MVVIFVWTVLSRDLVHGTVFLNSSPTAHLLAPLKTSQNRPIFTVILEQQQPTNSVKRLCSSFPLLTTLYNCLIYIMLHCG